MTTQDNEQQSTPQRQVSFSQDVLLYVDHKYSMKQRRAMFYTPKDMRIFGNEVHIQIKLARAIGDGVLKSMNQDCSFRGLEQLTDATASQERRRRKHMGQLAVFMEQDRQYSEDGNATPVDVDSMAHRYGNITKKSKELARQRAILYQEMEKVPSAPLQTKTTAPQTPSVNACTVAPKRCFSVGPSAA